VSPASVFVPHRGLETAIAVAKRLQDECSALIQDVETIGDETVIRLTIPSKGVGSFKRRRIELWSSFVRENAEARRALAKTTQEQIQERRVWLERSREMASSVRASLVSLKLAAATDPSADTEA
jgi:hypothetical protein